MKHDFAGEFISFCRFPFRRAERSQITGQNSNNRSKTMSNGALSTSIFFKSIGRYRSIPILWVAFQEVACHEDPHPLRCGSTTFHILDVQS